MTETNWAALPSTYRLQSSCNNGKHTTWIVEYDEEDELYCTKDALPRPKCSSCLMNEPHDESWPAWPAARRVAPHGVCDAYAKNGV